MNLTAVFENDCKMPVKFLHYQYDTDRHFTYIEDNEITYPALSDKYTIEFLNYYISFSLGDILIVLGLPLFAISGLKLTHKLRKIELATKLSQEAKTTKTR